MNFLLAMAAFFAAATASVTDGEVWNEGVDFYRAGDVTNALRVLRPLMLSKTHGARAAEVVAKMEHGRGNLEEAAVAAQIALRARPDDPKANRNFTRATDRLCEIRRTKHVNDVLKASEGKDPGGLMKAALADARELLTASGTYRTNAAPQAVRLADRLSARAEKLSDVWIPVRELIASSVTNEEQAATILLQVTQAQEKTARAAKELSDMDGSAYATMSDVENDCTRFYKSVVLPPAAMDEDLLCQSNAWQDVEAFNARAWQAEALDYTRAFRAKFPAWARAYEQQAQSDTNKPPFTAEAQAKVAALSTELEKLQLSCVEKVVASDQERSLELVREIRDLLPKDGSGGGQGASDAPQQQPDGQPPKDDASRPDEDKPSPGDAQQQQQDEEPPDETPPEADEAAGDEPEPTGEEREIEALLKKAQERNDEHEADKKARMRKAPLPPNERDW